MVGFFGTTIHNNITDVIWLLKRFKRLLPAVRILVLCVEFVPGFLSEGGCHPDSHVQSNDMTPCGTA